MPFKKTVKQEEKLRMAIAGIAGSGKTWTSLTLATALANGGSVALIDSEHGSASKYADDFQFDMQELSNFDPRNYIKAIREAEQAGYAVLIIDSLTHAWNGTGGALELVDMVAKQAAARRRKDTPNTFNAWSDVTPLQNKLINVILASPLHIIATMRSKTEYIVEKDSDGKSVPCKVGMAPIQRADVEYEFDIYADMNAENTMIIQKSRCRALSGKMISKPDGSLIEEVIGPWLAGAPAPVVVQLDDQIKQAKLRAGSLGLARDAAEWASLLRSCKIAQIKSTDDLAKVTEHMDQFERDAKSHNAPASTQGAAETADLASEQQTASIKKLCTYLKRAVPEMDGMTDATARQTIKDLTAAYKEARADLSTR
jgi:AAA domain